METESDRQKQFTRRALILGGGQAALVSALVARMYYLSVVQGKQYTMLADDNRLSLRLIAPLRGRILDRFGEELATNRQDLRAVLIPEQVKDIESILDALGGLIPFDAEDRERVIKQVKRQRAFVPVTLAENLSWTDFAKINVESPHLPGVQPSAGTSRYYPDGEVAAHVIGHVGAVSEADKGDAPVLQLPGFKVGKMGLEKAYEDALRGVAGHSRVEVNAYGRVIREVARQESKPGDDVRLTLYAPLQRRIAEKMGEESASAVVMDIESGDILAMTSVPAFDPNAFSVGISRDYWQSLLKDPRTPLVNKCIGGIYPPGSTFKMMVALAALEAGAVTPEDEFYCNGRHKLGNHFFHCWKRQGHGRVNMNKAIVQSCDIYFYNLAEKLGVDAIAEMATRFGLGRLHDMPIAGERQALIPTAAWKRATQGRPWVGGETLNMSIGQGYVLSTPLQLAVMASRIASGKAVAPRLVIDPERPKPPHDPLGVTEAHLNAVRAAMSDVVNTAHGTAYRQRIRTEGRSMAGKTGSAQVRRITMAERESGVREQEDLPWAERDHALFVCFGPVEKPRYAMSVVVEHGMHGGSAAAPIASEIMDWLQAEDPANRPVSGDVAAAAAKSADGKEG